MEFLFAQREEQYYSSMIVNTVSLINKEITVTVIVSCFDRTNVCSDAVQQCREL